MKSAKNLSLTVLILTVFVLISCCLWINLLKKNTPNAYPSEIPKLIEKFKDTYSPSYIMTEASLTGSRNGKGMDFDGYFENSTLIVKCTPSKDAKQLFNCTEQSVTVKEVYRGDKKLIGEEIKFTMSLSFEHNFKMIPFSFVNFMKHNEDYLLFLYPFGYSPSFDGGMETEPVKGMVNGNNFTTTVFGYIPYLSFSEHENVVSGTVGIAIDKKAPAYSKQVDNEFFVDNDATLKLLLDFKKEIIEKYTS